MKVLIVEDNPNMRVLLSDFVSHQFDQIVECSDGAEAFEYYARHRPDWVLMDWEMPLKDGITATREIIAEYPTARICIVTNFNDEFLRLEAFAAGSKGFVLKRNLAELEKVLTSQY